MYSYGPPHVAKQKQDDQLENTYSSSVRIRHVALKTCHKRWMIGRSGERGSGISMLAARHDDDDDSWPVIHLEVSDQRYYTFLYRHAKHNGEGGGKEQTKKHGLGSTPSARGGSLCDTLPLFVHLLTIASVYFVRNFYKATNNANIFSRWLTQPL